jgi:hypothetical protein
VKIVAACWIAVSVAASAAAQDAPAPGRPPIADLRTRMEAITLPDVEFRNAPLAEIVERIAEASVRADPSGVGVPIVPKFDAADARIGQRLTFVLRGASVARALQILCAAAELHLRVDRDAVVLTFSRNAVRPPGSVPKAPAP